jgi:hypothetical protein
MNDPQNKNESETIESAPGIEVSTSNTPVPDAEKVESAEASNREILYKPTAFSEGSAEGKPNKPPLVLAEPSEAPSESTPATIKVPIAPEPTAKETVASHAADSSISIDGDRDQNVGALVVDAIAAAVAIAFAVLLAQDVIPFL